MLPEQKEFPILAGLHETHKEIPAFQEALPENQPDAVTSLSQHSGSGKSSVRLLWQFCRANIYYSPSSMKVCKINILHHVDYNWIPVMVLEHFNFQSMIFN